MFLFCSHKVKRCQANQSEVVTSPKPASPGGGRGVARPIGGSANRPTRERKQYPALNANSQGAGTYGRATSNRPVVLVVEDEFLLRMDAVDIIAGAGFEVVEAASADQAIEILESRRDIAVVFTDIQMPGSMDGLKLAWAIRGRWPPIKIVATSGRPNLEETDLPEGGRFLPKPYSLLQVTGVLRELTDGEG